MLITQIREDVTKALKGGEGKKAELSTLRLLIAKLEKEKIEHKLTQVSGLSEEQVQSVIVKNIKELRKEIEAYEEVGRSTKSQEAEIELLLKYLLEQATEDEIRKEVGIAIGMTKRGEIKNPMQYLSGKLKGRANMALVTEIVKELQK